MSDLVRQAARQVLNESLSMLLPSARRRREMLDAVGGWSGTARPSSGDDRLVVPLARLDALAAAGIVSDEEREQWRSRYQRALALCDRPLPNPPAQLSERARRWLAEREPDAAAEIARAAPEDLEAFSCSRARALYLPAAEVRRCFAEVGLLPDDQAYAEMPSRPGPRRTELQAVAVKPQPTIVEPDLARAYRGPRRTQLRAVAPADDPSQGQARITCAELYTDGVVVRWILHLPREQADSDRRAHNQDLAWLLEQGRRHQPALRLTDDRDTEYQVVPTQRGISGPHGPTPTPGPLVVWGATTFTPAVPQPSERLDVHLDDRRISIPVTQS